ncbi:MAG: phosphotransferase enzyme family protein [Granulosicoccus sp.]
MKIGASYSTVSAEELLSKVVPEYKIVNPTTCLFWQRGINDTYQIHTPDEKYSLRVYRHKLRHRHEINFEISALNYLSTLGAKVAFPIEKHEGGYITEIQAPEGMRYVIITTHAEGSELDYDNAESARLFGKSIAEVHNLSTGFETQYTRPTLEREYLLNTSLETIIPFCTEMPAERKYLQDTAVDLNRILSNGNVSALDAGFCHGDCHGCNVHYDNGALTHFDFDCCGYGLRVFELATFKWGILGDHNEKELWTMFLDGYNTIRKISADDMALVDVYVVVRQLSWMALIMGNSDDFGHSESDPEFIKHNVGKIKKMLANI